MIFDIDHVALKVGDIDSISRSFQELGYSFQGKRRYDDVAMDIAFLGDGPGKLELIQPVDASSPVFSDPDGLHHVAIAVDDIEDTYTRMLQSDNFKLQGDIRQGAHSRIFFFRIRSEESTLYECVEKIGKTGGDGLG